MRIAAVFILVAGIVIGAEAQILPKKSDPGKKSLMDSGIKDQKRPPAEVKSLFEKIEQGIAGGAVGLFGGHFGNQVSMSIDRGETGYFSAAQAISILQNYLSNHKPAQFSFSRLNETASTPFATGRLSFVSKGTKESVQIYISLKRQDSEWVISQFNIY